MKLALILFPNTSSDTLPFANLKNALNCEVGYVRQSQPSLEGFDAVLIPGDSAGDNTQTQNIPSNIISAIKDAAADEKPIIGVGSGFQFLIDIGLLPGQLHSEADIWHISRHTSLRVENKSTIFTNRFRNGDEIDISTIGGRYYQADIATLDRLKLLDQIVFTFQDRPEGSAESIAGVINSAGNVLGMLPQPTGSMDFLVSAEGIRMFKSVKRSVYKAKRRAKREYNNANRDENARNGCIGGIIEAVGAILEAIFS